VTAVESGREGVWKFIKQCQRRLRHSACSGAPRRSVGNRQVVRPVRPARQHRHPRPTLAQARHY
jgi:hypothetical protein